MKIEWKSISSRKKSIAVVVGLFIIVLAITIIYVTSRDLRTYSRAKRLFYGEQYDQAAEVYKDLGDYKDARSLYEESVIQMATMKYEEGAYEDSIELLKRILDNQTAEELYFKNVYDYGKTLMTNEQFAAAAEQFIKIEEYQDAFELAVECYVLNSVDGRFLRSIVAANQSRWTLETRNNLTGEELEKQQFDLVEAELTLLEPYQDAEFNNKNLRVYSRQYLEGIEKQKLSVEYIRSDYETYDRIWKEGYILRAIALSHIYKEFSPKYDAEYMEYINEVVEMGTNHEKYGEGKFSYIW